MTSPARADIEAILPLTPMQESLLFATLAAGDAAEDPGFLQLTLTLRGDLDELAFRQAWQHVVARHAALRTSVHWKDTGRPLQVVARRAEVPVRFEDWRDTAAAGQDARLAAFLGDDRRGGLDPANGPVMRVAVLRTDDDVRRLVWSCHHLLLDGWSGALVLGEVAAAYASLAQGREARLPDVRPYRDFVGWLQRRDASAAEAFWRDALAGLLEPTPLPFDRMPLAGPARRHDEVALELTADVTSALHAFARRQRLTPGTLVHGAWALLLAGHAGEDRVCFGTTLSGRSAPLPGIEAMVGVFSNTLPVVCAVEADATVSDFLHTLQEQLAALQMRAHDSAAGIHEWSGVTGTRRLYDSLVVVENFPTDGLRGGAQEGLRWQDLDGGVTTGQALALVAVPGERLRLQLLHDPARIAAEDAQRLGDGLRRILEHMPGAPDARVAELMPARAEPRPGRDDASADGGSAAPTSSLELRVWKLWEQVLDTPDFGIDDDFFDLGGYSLLVARLLRLVEERLGVRVPVGTFFRAPTVRALAGEIDRLLSSGGETPQPPVIVPLAPGGDDDPRPPLFFVHGIEGDVVPSYNLVRYLAAGQRVWGVQADDAVVDGTTFEAMAARYARAMREVEPDGPYSLVGYCLGGALAFETARQLSAQGGTVALLAVIDADPHMPGWPRNSRLMRAWWNLQMTPRGQRAAVFRRKVRKAMGMLVDAIRPAAARNGAHGSEAAAARALDAAHVAAYQQYHPRPWNGPITVVLARDDPPGLARWRRRAWKRLGGEDVDVHTIPGTHYTLMGEPSVRALAGRVQTSLDAAADPVPEDTARSD